ncbi:MAG: aspartate carbamoyltransferase catalytic subunit [Armatimonadota bacterium]
MSRNLIAIRTMPNDEIVGLLDLATEFKAKIIAGEDVPSMKKTVIGLLFFENSTRTRVSFEQAAFYLGMRSSNFATSASSMNKGETLKDTILTLRHERINGLVMRHKASGAPMLAAKHFGGPVLNAGDGQHEHPTQALADALTILERKTSLVGLNVSIVGDVVHSRVARSNAWLLDKLGANVRLVGPRTLLPPHPSMLPGEFCDELEEGISGADVIICLRLQKERMAEGMISSIGEYSSLYQINAETLRFANPGCLVMHPGPINRGVEIDDVTADGDSSVINQQVENGVFVRMAAFYWCFGGQQS